MRLVILAVYNSRLGIDQLKTGWLKNQGLDPGQGLLLKSLSHVSSKRIVSLRINNTTLGERVKAEFHCFI